ncbi:MAG: acylphosphatase [Candidatus Melainabacteria bacterium RIFCSPHIGHO2_02_FULL_34_12]|nr:MAG: acylphosphatase [Candidatus Melainabacteria bacterium RIFCSPHIGHO2_02_FULL_34_12]
MEMYQSHLIVSGRVQGVFYRASCQDVAVKYGLNGWVKNLSTGDVEVLVQGEKEQIEKLIEWCKKGPPNAKVSDVKIEWQEMSEEINGFSVR